MIDKLIIGGVAIVGLLGAAAWGHFKKSKYDQDGYDQYGYDKDGYDRDGYNKNGFNHLGYNRDGFDIHGYDHEGFNSEGFDNRGFDHEGYNKSGFDKEGYDRLGKDRFGYYHTGYNDKGLDRGNKTSNYYIEKISEINDLLEKSHCQMKKEEFGYALHDIRIGLEKGIKCIITHWMGNTYVKERLDDNITICKKYELFERNYIDELYSAKKHCNSTQHDNEIEKEYRQVHFAYKVLEELKNNIEQFTNNTN